MRTYGHRGYPYRFRENTLAAIEAAINKGVDGVEIDVRCCADEVIVYHDPTFWRLDKKPKIVSLTTLKETKKINQEIPTLKEVLAQFGGSTEFILDLKSDSLRQLEKSVCQIIKDYGLETNVILASNKAASIVKCFNYSPLTRRALLLEPRILPSLKTSLLERGLSLTGIHPHVSLINSRRVHRWRKRGLDIITWGEQHPSDFEKIHKFDLDLITKKLWLRSGNKSARAIPGEG